jgi:hypothetical protein
MHRQSIDELVGDDDRGIGRHFIECAVPQHRQVETLQPPLLGLSQRRTDLNQMNHNGGAKAIDDLRRPQRIRHQRAATGPEFDHAEVFRRTHLPPDRRHPQSDQLAEHLADLRRGDEIACGTDRLAVDVIPMLRMAEAELHVLGDRDRARRPDDAANLALQWRALVSHLWVSVRG